MHPLTALILAMALSLGVTEPASASTISAAAPLKADRVVVLKSERRLVLLRGDRVLRAYRIALGRYAEDPKMRKGDAKTPEGTYIVDYRIGSRRSKFYRALHISYPNARDRARAARMKIDPGGQIMIHGLPKYWSAREVGHPTLDWTQGCIAVTNREMDEIWGMVSDGTTVEIRP